MINDTLNWLIETVQQLDPTVRVLLAGLAIVLETSVLIGLIVPGDTVLLIASVGVRGWPDLLILVIVAIIGALIGETLGYWLGRWLGRPLQRSWLGRKIGDDHWERAERLLQRRGRLAVFISRFIPILHSLVPVTAGIAGMSYRRFLSATAPACTLWSIAYVSVGAGATAGYQELGHKLHWIGYVFVGVILVFVLVMWLLKRFLAKRVEADMREPNEHITNTEPHGAHSASATDQGFAPEPPNSTEQD